MPHTPALSSGFSDIVASIFSALSICGTCSSLIFPSCTAYSSPLSARYSNRAVPLPPAFAKFNGGGPSQCLSPR